MEIGEPPPGVSQLHRFIRVFTGRKLVLFGAVIIVLFLIAAAFGPLFSPYGPNEQQLDHILKSPSRAHLLGTDHLGRDTLSRLIYGSRNSLMVGVVGLAIAAIVGMTMGMLAGYFNGWVNIIIMRLVDVLMSFPMILLALIISALLGGGLKNVMIAIGIAMIPGYARLMCGVVTSTKEADYVLAERSMGSGNIRIMLGHILPNCFPPLIVLITIQIGAAILTEASLSYLGIGIIPPAPAWGAMVNSGYRYLSTNVLLSFAPGLAIMLVVFAFNMVGDGLRDALDPRLRGLI
ncbi:MAG: ABC transporter permease [Deltaproteobacteria bacterium]|nr:ABC transporter permease [Deltaproteobacteria bacterium]